MSYGPWLAGATAAAVIGAVAVGLFLLGSPTQERARRVDDRRVSDLKGITAATNLYWTRHAALPASIAELTAEPGVSIVTLDPARLEPYEYQPLDSMTYELCAVFERESGEISLDPDTNLWAHGSGRQCFQLEAERITNDGR